MSHRTPSLTIVRFPPLTITPQVRRLQAVAALPAQRAPAIPKDPPPGWPASAAKGGGGSRGGGPAAALQLHLAWSVSPNPPGPPASLSGCSFSAAFGEATAVVGRGPRSGLPALAPLLARLSPCASGRALLCGADLSHLPPDTIRRALAVVPRDTLLLSGPLRASLDPLGRRTDAELRAALDAFGASRADLRSAVRARAFGVRGDSMRGPAP